eukprot:scaffold304903_cov40-Tisochrysis_lutea.AAC.3
MRATPKRGVSTREKPLSLWGTQRRERPAAHPSSSLALPRRAAVRHAPDLQSRATDCPARPAAAAAAASAPFRTAWL